jgi:hypothetical protein
LSFLRLAGDQAVLFFCLDEIEAIQAGTWDAVVLRQFTTLATDLVADSGPRVVATFVRSSTLLAINKSVEVSNVQKIAQFSVSVPALTWEQTARVAGARLDAEATCRTARQAHPGETFWPLRREFFEDTFQKNKRILTPRHLLLAARVEFERLAKGEPGSGQGSDLGKRGTPDEVEDVQDTAAPHEFATMWKRHRNRLLERLQGIQFDTVMGIGLPWLAGLTASPFVRVQDSDPQLADLNLLFHHESGRQKPVGVSFCNHDPRSLWRRLDRVLAQWNAARGRLLGTLVVLRPDTPPPTPAAQARLDALAKSGVRVLLITRQQLAELAAFQALLTAALAGDLTRDGKPVPAGDYGEWAKGNVSGAVTAFFSQVFAAGTTPPAPSPPPATAVKRTARTRATK